MFYHLLADLVVLLHLAFIVFAVSGGILVIWWQRVIWIHLPAAVWAAWIAFSAGICPLTHLENWLQMKGGRGGYPGDFIQNYIIPIVYPGNLTRKIQIVLAAVVIVVNLLMYGYALIIRRKA